MEITVAGKRVVFRDRTPARQNWPMLALSQLAVRDDEQGYEALVKLATMLIEEWEFPGDPKDPTSYAELDLFGEFLPLTRAISEELARRSEMVKN